MFVLESYKTDISVSFFYLLQKASETCMFWSNPKQTNLLLSSQATLARQLGQRLKSTFLSFRQSVLPNASYLQKTSGSEATRPAKRPIRNSGQQKQQAEVVHPSPTRQSGVINSPTSIDSHPSPIRSPSQRRWRILTPSTTSLDLWDSASQ